VRLGGAPSQGPRVGRPLWLRMLCLMLTLLQAVERGAAALSLDGIEELQEQGAPAAEGEKLEEQGPLAAESLSLGYILETAEGEVLLGSKTELSFTVATRGLAKTNSMQHPVTTCQASGGCNPMTSKLMHPMAGTHHHLTALLCRSSLSVSGAYMRQAALRTRCTALGTRP
jgi:hypothetical protein